MCVTVAVTLFSDCDMSHTLMIKSLCLKVSRLTEEKIKTDKKGGSG